MAIAAIGLGWWAWSDHQPGGLSVPELAALEVRDNGKPLPEIQVVDMAREFGAGNRKMTIMDGVKGPAHDA